jgi:hypothetical protein
VILRRSPAQSADAGSLPSVLALTMVRDEGAMLSRWVDHYAAQLGADRLLVLDDNSSDGSTDDLPCPVVRLPATLRKPFEAARMGIVSGVAAGLLDAFDAVCFTDADELLVADPARHAGLRELVAARRQADVIGAIGLNVIHHLAEEAPLDPGRPVSEQRRLAKFLPLMCKPAVKRVPAAWAHASHAVTQPYEVDPDLYMFHLKFADRDALRAVADHRRRMVELDGRAESTSWRFGGDDMVALLDEVNRALELQPEIVPFSPPLRRLRRVVERQPNGIYKATGLGQVPAMQKLPVVSIPERFVGTF